MTLFLSTSNPRTMNKLQFPAASPSSRPPHTPQVCRLPPGLLPSHRSSPTTAPRFPAAGIRPLHIHLHSGSPPPPRAPPRPDSPASPRPRARAHTHTFSRFPNLLPRTETSQLRGNSARPAEGDRHPSVCLLRPLPPSLSQPPPPSREKRGHSNSPATPDVPPLCLLRRAPNLRPAPRLRTGPAPTLTGDTARSAGSSSAAASFREASARLSGSSERPRGTTGAGGRRHLPLLRLLLARRGGGGE